MAKDLHKELAAVDKERAALDRKIQADRKQLAKLNARSTELDQKIHFAKDEPPGSARAPGARFEVVAGRGR